MKRYISVMSLSMIFLAGCAPVQVAPTDTALPMVASATMTATPSATAVPVQVTPTNTALPTVTVTASTLGIGSTMISENDGMILMSVPAGEFTMGVEAEDVLPVCAQANISCSVEWFRDQEPPHTVYLDAFWIDQTEVINRMYAECVQAGKCDPPSSTKSYTRDSYYGNAQFDDYPVLFVSWEAAKSYCAWVDRRLPTEAEWEKAARGMDARAYPWGNDFPNDELLNYKHAMTDTTVVGTFPKGVSPYGALDMAGNVWEWVADWYGGTYYETSPSSNPPGPDSGTERVMRGGAFGSGVHNVTSTFRLISAPADTYAWVGFRCAMSATP